MIPTSPIDHQQAVGERVGDAPEARLGAQPAGEEAVEEVGRPHDAEDDRRRHRRRPLRGDQDDQQDREGRQARQREGVRQPRQTGSLHRAILGHVPRRRPPTARSLLPYGRVIKR